jgi:hypothetical protein
MRRIYAFKWVLSTGYDIDTHSFKEENRKPQTACGSDSIRMIDGRLSRYNMKLFAENWAKKNNAIGYSIGFLECHDPNEKHSQSIVKFTKI